MTLTCRSAISRRATSGAFALRVIALISRPLAIADSTFPFLNSGFLGTGLLALHDEQIQWIRLSDT
jgi:hypothetical protein